MNGKVNGKVKCTRPTGKVQGASPREKQPYCGAGWGRDSEASQEAIDALSATIVKSGDKKAIKALERFSAIEKDYRAGGRAARPLADARYIHSTKGAEGLIKARLNELPEVVTDALKKELARNGGDYKEAARKVYGDVESAYKRTHPNCGSTKAKQAVADKFGVSLATVKRYTGKQK